MPLDPILLYVLLLVICKKSFGFDIICFEILLGSEGCFLDAFVSLFLDEFGEDLVIIGMLSFVTVFCMFFCSDYF